MFLLALQPQVLYLHGPGSNTAMAEKQARPNYLCYWQLLVLSEDVVFDSKGSGLTRG